MRRFHPAQLLDPALREMHFLPPPTLRMGAHDRAALFDWLRRQLGETLPLIASGDHLERIVRSILLEVAMQERQKYERRQHAAISMLRRPFTFTRRK